MHDLALSEPAPTFPPAGQAQDPAVVEGPRCCAITLPNTSSKPS